MKLAVMGDLHYHEIDEAIPGWAEARNDFYQTFLKHFFTTEADIHISLGDLTNYGYASELNEVYGIVKQYDTTFYHALGNHDLYAQTRKESARNFRTSPLPRCNYRAGGARIPRYGQGDGFQGLGRLD
ncbi:metallophosphoesterase family protein [Paenibacillus sp. TAB 01]|uniref:metallophosphoesterase family protein n=1 Tax=Paenibacillus sp. TAB 01 TaxID=3368988 RepID=UPI00375317A0